MGSITFSVFLFFNIFIQGLSKMKFNNNEHEYILNTGKIFPANHGLIGINHELVAHGGYDQVIHEDSEFTPEERKEISEYMIELWKEWAK